MIYVCVKQFDDIYFHKVIPCGYRTRLYSIDNIFKRVHIDYFDRINVDFPAPFFFEHFKLLSEVRYHKLDSLLESDINI